MVLLSPTISEIGENISVTISGVNTAFLDYSLTNESIFLINDSNTIISSSINIITNDVLQVDFVIPDNENFSGIYEIVLLASSDNNQISYSSFAVQNFNNYYLNLGIDEYVDAMYGYFSIDNLFNGENYLVFFLIIQDLILKLIQLADNSCYTASIYLGNYTFQVKQSLYLQELLMKTLLNLQFFVLVSLNVRIQIIIFYK